jgi:UDP-2,4-diacetamido-2,4,6-trideoxy-beta-L-altropyranose hydrolase
LATTLTDRPRLAFRADAGPGVGLGHVRRCLALATAASWAEPWLLIDGPHEVAEATERAGVATRLVPPGAQPTLAAVAALGAHVLVVDSYRLGAAAVRQHGPQPRLLTVLDDAGRFPLPADLVVSPALGLEAPPGEESRYLLGPGFAPLALEFAAVPSRPADGVERLLVTLGGTSPPVLLGALVRAARAAVPSAVVDVVVGPLAAATDGLSAELGGAGGVTLHRKPATLRPLMAAADLAVSAGGVTLLELAATATPSVAIVLVANQAAAVAGLAGAGAVVSVGDAAEGDVAARVRIALAALAADPGRRRVLGGRARELVDGRGAVRVAEALRTRLAGPLAAGAARRA